ncbi:SRPBCC family protein [Roseimicrobium sp. ORNL1]|uniref:SRPBCC family protein n=1 Tax=Roseimicrobium sp. ORNL1 TaxID=2711231 RepID=UPI0013E14945|nr:SRPBCC family protein [Roseimicrobium sp. ORNL1]QIF01705.1 hypothetical protein G5S37_09270 [Roseimicrobium sp. ORNL1]
MTSIQVEIHIACPAPFIHEALRQHQDWPTIAPESFVEAPREIGDRLWIRTRVTGAERVFGARLVSFSKNRVSWDTDPLTKVSGEVTLQEMLPGETRLLFEFRYRREGMIEAVFASGDLVKRRLEDDLERLKQVLEERHASGGPSGGEN